MRSWLPWRRQRTMQLTQWLESSVGRAVFSCLSQEQRPWQTSAARARQPLSKNGVRWDGKSVSEKKQSQLITVEGIRQAPTQLSFTEMVLLGPDSATDASIVRVTHCFRGLSRVALGGDDRQSGALPSASSAPSPDVTLLSLSEVPKCPSALPPSPFLRLAVVPFSYWRVSPFFSFLRFPVLTCPDEVLNEKIRQEKSIVSPRFTSDKCTD